MVKEVRIGRAAGATLEVEVVVIRIMDIIDVLSRVVLPIQTHVFTQVEGQSSFSIEVHPLPPFPNVHLNFAEMISIAGPTPIEMLRIQISLLQRLRVNK